jgi:hypothetical protein
MRSGEKQRNKGLPPSADIIRVLFNSHSPSILCIFLLSMRHLPKQEILFFFFFFELVEAMEKDKNINHETYLLVSIFIVVVVN